MPAYHIILRAFNSWNADHPSGWSRHGDKGRRPTNPGLARHRRFRSGPEARFHPQYHPDMVTMTKDLCAQRQWRLHGTTITATHVHAAISWRTSHTESHVNTTIKRLLGLQLARTSKEPGKKWFAHDGDPVQIKNRHHLLYLLHEYFRKQGGTFWREEST